MIDKLTVSKIEKLGYHMADIVWFLRGLKINSKDWPFEDDQEESLEEVISILIELRDQKNTPNDKGRNENGPDRPGIIGDKQPGPALETGI